MTWICLTSLLLSTQPIYWAKQLDARKPKILLQSRRTGLVEHLGQGIRNWLRNTWPPSTVFLPQRNVDISLATRKPKRSRTGRLSTPYSWAKISLCFFCQKTTNSQLAVYTCYTALVVEKGQLQHWDCQLWDQGIDGRNNCISKDPATRKEYKQTVGTGPQQNRAAGGERQ